MGIKKTVKKETPNENVAPEKRGGMQIYRGSIKVDLIDENLIQTSGKNGETYKHEYLPISVVIYDNPENPELKGAITTWDKNTSEKTYIANLKELIFEDKK